MKIEDFIYAPQKHSSVKDFNPDETGNYKDKESAKKDFKNGVKELSKMQDMFYAHNAYSILLIFQAMDAAGKDGTIKHVMSGVNPQGCQVNSFKAPSTEELDHDYLWRCVKQLPERGRIGIFNRSYYEEVLVTKVHPEFLTHQNLPDFNGKPDKKFWEKRYADINNFEKYLTNNGTVILKFFLNVSKEEQKERLLARIDDASKNWKFSINDLPEREHWDHYMNAYKDVLENTSTDYAPWYVVPANKKWFMRTLVAQIIVERMKQLNIHYPEITKEQKNDLAKAKKILLGEM